LPSDFADRFPTIAGALLRAAGWRAVQWNFTARTELLWYPPENPLQDAFAGISLSDAWEEYERRQKLYSAGWFLYRYGGGSFLWYPPGTPYARIPHVRGRSITQALDELRQGAKPTG
jgi:hypothetical protein